MPINPKRGEIWRVRLGPTVRSEIGKTRPCVVLSNEEVGRLPLRIVVPITEWQTPFATYE